MKNNLGIMLGDIRKKSGIAQMCIADGIISSNFMCKLERGEKEPDYLVIESLFERLGKCADKVEKGITNDDYELIRLRDEIADCISYGHAAQARKKLAEYMTWADRKSNIHKQYFMEMEALITYLETRDAQTCMQKLAEALRVTNVTWKEYGEMYLCNQEVRIFLLIAYMQIEQGKLQEAEIRLRWGSNFLIKHYAEGEELVKLYPHTIWLLAKTCFLQHRTEEALYLIQKAKECLGENSSLMPMYLLLLLEADCLKALNRQEELTENEECRKTFAFMYEIANEEMPTEEVGQLLLCSQQREYVILNHLVKEVRESKGMTQEQLCEDICEQESLSRIESGKRKPHRKVLYQLLEKLGINRGQYYGFIIADDYTLYEKVRDYKRCEAKEEWEKEKLLFREIEEKLDKNGTLNRQFVDLGRLLMEDKLHGKEKREVLQNILYATMPEIAGKEMPYRTPFRMEYSILNNIAISYREEERFDQAIHVYENIQKAYEYSQVSMRYHAVPGLTFYVNYPAFLEDNDELEAALKKSDEGIKFAISICRGDIIGSILANRSCIYEKTGETDLEEKCLLYGYCLTKMYKNNKMKTVVEKKYFEKYNSKL